MEVVSMHTDLIFILLTLSTLLFSAGFVIVGFLVVKPFLDKIADTKEMHVMNEKYALFNSIDINNINEILDKYFSNFVNRYMVYKFMSKKITYIKDAEVETMITDLTKLIAVDISELYIFYIKMTTSITDQDSLLLYIRNKIQAETIDAVSTYNRSNIETATPKK